MSNRPYPDLVSSFLTRKTPKRPRLPRPTGHTRLTGERGQKMMSRATLANLQVWHLAKIKTCGYRSTVATRRLFGMDAVQYMNISKIRRDLVL